MTDTENCTTHLKLFQLHHKASTGSCASTNSSVLHEEKRGPQEGPRAAQPAGTNNTNGTVTPSEESNTMELEEKQPLTELSDLTRYGN